MTELKDRLLDTKYFIENTYLEEYLMLVRTNKNTKSNYNTQSHHIIPKGYFKTLMVPIDNSEKNLVNLLYKDHIRAHWLLFNCTVDFLKKQSATAVRKMINCKKDSLLKELTLEEYNLLQLQYEQTCLQIDRDTLYTLYVINNNSRIEIADKYNCSVSCIKKLLEQYKIVKNNFESIDKQTFIKYYKIEDHTLLETAQYFGISTAKTSKLLDLYNCHKTYRADSLWKTLNFDEVYLQYKNGTTLRALAKKYSINESRFYSAFRLERKKYEDTFIQ